MPGPFDDDLTLDEEKLLTTEPVVPVSDDDDGNPPTVADAVAEAAATAATAAPADAAANSAAGTDEDDEELRAFLEKNKDKSPEDLAKLAFQQQKRANKAAAGSRVVREQVSALAQRAQAAMAAREEAAKAAPTLKQAFREKLTNDPDAATAELYDQMVDRQVAAADAEAQRAQIDNAIAFADTHIPEFGKQWPNMQGLAKEIGFSDDELNGIDDGRSLVMLSLANHAARLMKAGVMDRFGNIVNAPTPSLQPVDPRLAAPDPQRTLSGGPRATKASSSVEQQLAELAEMSDADLAKIDPKVIDGLLRQAAA